MTNYARGANFERQVKADLEGRGYFVIRAAGSHGIVDLVAFPPSPIDDPLFIQCKINGKISPDDRAELYRVARRTGCWPVMATRPNRGIIFYSHYFQEEDGGFYWQEIL